VSLGLYAYNTRAMNVQCKTKRQDVTRRFETRAKTRHESVETGTRQRHENNVSRDKTENT